MDILDAYPVPSTPAPAPQNAAPNANARKSDDGVDFANFVFDRPAAPVKSAANTDRNFHSRAALSAKTADDQAFQTKGAARQKKDNDLAKFLSVNAKIEKEVGKINDSKIYDGDPQAQIAAVLALNQKALEGDIKATTVDPNSKAAKDAKASGGNPAAPSVSKSLLLDIFKNRKDLLSAISLTLSKLQNLAKDSDGALIVANLTPAQITDLKSKVDALLAKINAGSLDVDLSGETKTDDKKEDDALAGVLLGLIKLLPPQQTQAIIVPQSISITPLVADPQTPAASESPDDIISKLNSLLSGDLTAETKGAARPSKENFDQALKQTADKGDAPNFGILQDGKTDAKAAANPTPSTKADGSLLTGWDFSDSGSFQFNASDIAQALMNNIAAQSASPLSITGPGSAASLVTQAASATTPLPATQMVAASIQKAAADGVSKITLELEPAELGKIEVRLSFGRDKTVKAVVVAEHSDTINMLQRDGHFLERAFQNAGLDSDKSSLSFELAKEGYSFNGDQGSNSHGGGRNSQKEDIEPIKSTMNWYVDSHTGQTHYDILA